MKTIPQRTVLLPALTALLLLPLTLPSHANAQSQDPSASRDDLAWLKSKGTLLFADAFDRKEDGNGAKAIGNGWESATADRVPHIKQSVIEEGILKVVSAKEAGHGAHIHHDAGFGDGGVYVRFKLPGLSKAEMLQAGFVDREVSATVHAGHLGYVFLSEASVAMKDTKTFYLKLKELKDSGVTDTAKLAQHSTALDKETRSTKAHKLGNDWHDLVLVTEGDVMRVSIDGKLVNEYKSPGFAHPHKRWFSLVSSSSFWVDEVKIWRVN
jgi:hypothetical protein